MNNPEYAQGICEDGAAILREGQPMTIEEILDALRDSEQLKAEVERLREERDQLKGRLKKLNSAATAVIDSRAALGLDSNRYSVDMNLLIELSHCRPAQQAKEVQS